MSQAVYSIPAGAAFAKTLALDLLDRTAGKPEILPTYRIFLPTRRACRVLRDTFLSLGEGKPVLLPRMMPLGDVEEEELSLMVFGHDEGFLEIPPAMPPLQRQIMLAKLIAARPDYAQGIDQALRLSQELGRFMDQVTIEGLDFAALERIVPDEFAAHWQVTLEFLKIVTEIWPAVLAEEGMIDAADRRTRLMKSLAEFWQKSPPDSPVIAAGSTGSIPATAELLRVISGMKQGAVYLPGLDQEMDEASWNCLDESHPQFGLKQLLGRLGVGRAEVKLIGTAHDRNILAREVMRPAETTQQWKDLSTANGVDKMLEGLEYYPCHTQQEEAQVIALILREALEKPENIAALITPDRGLARRVSACCQRWGIEVDDSAGLSLKDAKIGKFILLSLQSCAASFNPSAFLGVLKSGYCDPLSVAQQTVFRLEREVLRKGHIIKSFDALYDIAQTQYAASDAQDILGLLNTVLPIMKAMPARASMAELLAAHLKMLESLAGNADNLWRGDDGEAAASFFINLQTQASQLPVMSVDEYARVLSVLMTASMVRVPYGVHPRVLILGQLEARLSGADVLVLGGLNEGIWPSDTGHDPWLSRPMRKAFGLPAPERSIGLAAHDFVQGMCGPRVVLTRSSRVGNAPSVPSRWLQRLEIVLKACDRDINQLARAPYQDWVKAMDDAAYTRSERPAPRPPVDARLKGISITRVEPWINDPYQIYASEILGLRKLKALDQEQDDALRGTILHETMEKFIEAYPVEMPEDSEEEFLRICKMVSAQKLQDEAILRQWWPRFLRAAHWAVTQEETWREQAKFHAAEVEGSAEIVIDGEPFTLRGKPDRIDRIAGAYAIIDYKTGGQFSSTKLKSGELPQMPLAAMILARGGFDGRGLYGQGSKKKFNYIQATTPIQHIAYWKITGGREAGKVVAIHESDTINAIKTVEDGFAALVRYYRDPQTAFTATPDSINALRFNDYEHLERVKEWAALDEDTSADSEGDF